jgi:glycosyltransferase involved in cell wall biosynthesis
MSAASPGPRISIVMPTYNRRDTILRAVASVRAQTFDGWELIVVDDGSTDDTIRLLAGGDPRVRVVLRDHRGVAIARNAGLEAVRGEFVAFLDSDDEWPAHHLAVAAGFFDAHPHEHVYTSELWEDFGRGPCTKHFRVETAEWYPRTARRIGSTAFEWPPPEGDPYLWHYESRQAPGAWAQAALDGAATGGVWHYRGRIYDQWRWGWLMSLGATVITRHAMETVGPNDTTYVVASDFGYLAALCRAFPVNFLSAPGCIKHEFARPRRRPAADHLVTGGRTATRFHQDVLRFHEELFWTARPDDPELSALRGFRQSLVAQAALRSGAREIAVANLEQASRTYPGPDTSSMLRLARSIPQATLASLAYRGSLWSARVAARLRARMSRGRAP